MKKFNLDLPFEDKIVLVTGSGRGIGRAIALNFSRLGSHVVVNFFRNRKPAEQTAADIQALGQQALVVKADIGTDEGQDHLFEENVIKSVIDKTPAGRLISPEDIAQVVAFLCSTAATMIRGQVILVDGGYTLGG